jgi:hypothetical protein
MLPPSSRIHNEENRILVLIWYRRVIVGHINR